MLEEMTIVKDCQAGLASICLLTTLRIKTFTVESQEHYAPTRIIPAHARPPLVGLAVNVQAFADPVWPPLPLELNLPGFPAGPAAAQQAEQVSIGQRDHDTVGSGVASRQCGQKVRVGLDILTNPFQQMQAATFAFRPHQWPGLRQPEAGPPGPLRIQLRRILALLITKNRKRHGIRRAEFGTPLNGLGNPKVPLSRTITAATGTDAACGEEAGSKQPRRNLCSGTDSHWPSIGGLLGGLHSRT
jgi:hypothetical protein